MQPTPRLGPATSSPALDPKAVKAALRDFELQASRASEVAEIRDWLAGLIHPEIARAEAAARVHELMGDAALFLRREAGAITGMLGWIALSQAGLDASWAGRFSGQAPDDAHVARPGQAVAGGYGWGIAASHKTAARAVLGATVALNYDLFPTVPFFTRAATPDGRRVILERFGYEPAPGGASDVFWKPAGRERAA